MEAAYTSLKVAAETDPELAEIRDSSPQHKRLFDLALKLPQIRVLDRVLQFRHFVAKLLHLVIIGDQTDFEVMINLPGWR